MGLSSSRHGRRLSVTGAPNEPGVLEDLKMPGNRRLAYRERCGQLCYGGFAASEPTEDCSPRRVGQGEERGMELAGAYIVHNLLII